MTLYKIWAFTLAGFLAGIAGGLLAGSVGQLDGRGFPASDSILLFALTVVGGSLTLSGTNNYSGGTTVNGGTLIVTNSQGIEDGTNLNIGSGLGAFSSPIVPDGGSAAATANSQAASAVPEAGTLSLMVAALCGAAVYRRLRRSRRAVTVAEGI